MKFLVESDHQFSKFSIQFVPILVLLTKIRKAVSKVDFHRCNALPLFSSLVFFSETPVGHGHMTTPEVRVGSNHFFIHLEEPNRGRGLRHRGRKNKTKKKNRKF